MARQAKRATSALVPACLVSTLTTPSHALATPSRTRAALSMACE